jgi:localization factor PodJL
LASIEEHLATSDEFIVEAARQAAEAALRLFRADGQCAFAAIDCQHGGHHGARRRSEGSRRLSRKTEDRTMRAFEAVQET